MKHLIICLTGMLFFSTVALAQSKDSEEKCKGLNKRATVLISQYKDLRIRRSRKQQGTFDKDLDAYGGKLHEVLSALGVELGRPPYTKEIIVGCLGEPDSIKSGKEMGGLLEIYKREQRKAGRKVEEKSNREYLIYFWRGWHDLLFFISEDGLIVDHGWWFAYE
jgi:hypothetical protein